MGFHLSSVHTEPASWRSVSHSLLWRNFLWPLYWKLDCGKLGWVCIIAISQRIDIHVMCQQVISDQTINQFGPILRLPYHHHAQYCWNVDTKITCIKCMCIYISVLWFIFVMSQQKGIWWYQADLAQQAFFKHSSRNNISWFRQELNKFSSFCCVSMNIQKL